MTFALIGDSQAEGLAPWLRRELGSDLVFVDARRGRPTSEFLDARIPQVDVLIAILGGNDTASSRYPATLELTVDAFRARSRRIVWVGPSAVDVHEDPETAERHDAARAAQARVLPRLGVEFLDPRAWQVGAAGEHAPDGVHFTRAAYELQASAVLEALEGGLPWGWIAFGIGGVASAIGLGYALAQR